jgi:hypothetical protein
VYCSTPRPRSGRPSNGRTRSAIPAGAGK